MAFDGAGDLYACAPYAYQHWLNLAAANGQTLTSGSFVGQVTADEVYSLFGGNMAARRGRLAADSSQRDGGFVPFNPDSSL